MKEIRHGPIELLVIVAGVLLTGFPAWFFFGPTQARRPTSCRWHDRPIDTTSIGRTVEPVVETGHHDEHTDTPLATDPVCGMTIHPVDAAATLSSDGTTTTSARPTATTPSATNPPPDRSGRTTTRTTERSTSHDHDPRPACAANTHRCASPE